MAGNLRGNQTDHREGKPCARRSTNHAKTAGGVAGAVAALVAYLVAIGAINLPFGGHSVEHEIEEFAADANKDLPWQIDELTRWDRVEPGPGKAYSYIYTLSEQLTEEEKRTIREITTGEALAAPDMQATFEAGVTVWYKYYDTSGTKVLEFAVKKDD